MNVFFGLQSLPKFRKAVVTIGTFDGVHIGHKVILDRLKKKAQEIAGETIIITFEPHPRFVLANNQQPISLLNTLDEKISNMEQEGIDNLVVVNFTKEFAAMDAADYVEKFLIAHFHPHTVIIGYDHLFGNGRKGNFQLLEQLKTKFIFELEEISMQIVEQNKVSSTQIRTALKVGDVVKAAKYLGRHYTIEGKVVQGSKRGREIGYPTANMFVEDSHKLIPAMGVYAVRVIVNEKLFGGMMNIGLNPTFVNDQKITLEVHIFDFNVAIYGEMIRVHFVERLRDEIKFENVQQLVLAIDNDKLQALKSLGIH